MITLTEAASTKMKELIDAQGQPGLALRVAVRTGGCCALRCDISFEAVLDPQDETAQFGGVTIVVDPASARHLEGASLDYHEGRLGPSFTLDNPNVTSCGGH